MKVCASYFSPEGVVPGTGRTDSKEWKEQAKGEMIVNSNYGTKQPPDTLNSSQLGNATKSFSFLCWACRARQIHPGEQLKPEQYLKMALWDKTGSAKRLITPQSWQFKFSLQELETPTGPGAVWGWQIYHTWFVLSPERSFSVGQGEGSFMSRQMVGFACCLGETYIPMPLLQAMQAAEGEHPPLSWHRGPCCLTKANGAGSGCSLGCAGDVELHWMSLASHVAPRLQPIPQAAPAGLWIIAEKLEGFSGFSILRWVQSIQRLFWL